MSNESYRVAETDGVYAVVRSIPEKPWILEVIATFYDKGDAADYAKGKNDPAVETVAETSDASPQPPEPSAPVEINDLTFGQKSVLWALCRVCDENGLASLSTKDIAESAKVPYGSVMEYLKALARKGCIMRAENDSGKRTSVYRILADRGNCSTVAEAA